MGAPSRYSFEVVERPTASQRQTLRGLLDRVTEADGRPPLSEQPLLALTEGGHGGAATVIARTGAGGGAGGEPAGLAQLLHHGHWELELAVLPDQRSPAGPAAGLARAALDYVAGHGGGTVHYWVDGDSDGPSGFRPGRELLELRTRLPLPSAVVSRGPHVELRPFRPGHDEQAWLAVNNRAFAGHPEQGDWDLPTLLEHEQAEWFDPEDFLLYETGGRLAASCWTKIHRQSDPPMGEIYVISVDPDFHGRGLGRALTVAGLAHLAGRGLSVGMLYVDGANKEAMGLYRSLGFEVHRVQRAYVASVAPTSAAGGASPA